MLKHTTIKNSGLVGKRSKTRLYNKAKEVLSLKRHGDLFNKICDYDNLKLAHKKARKDKLFYREVKEVDNNEEYYLTQIQEMLRNKTYKIEPSDYTVFKKMDKGKEREIFKLDYFPHRIVQHALMNVIQDILYKTLIDNTFSSIPGRGIHLALKRLSNDLKADREGTKYCLKLDVKKFYPSIDQHICKMMFRKKFKDNDVLWLIDEIISSMETDKGIAIGSLFSQWAGNYYLSYFDHWLKEEKRIRYYYRYCDDIVILHDDKNYLHALHKEIDAYLNSRLNLKVKENWQVFPTKIRGIDFVGYRHFIDYILLRKTTATNLKVRMNKIAKKVVQHKRMTYSDWCAINSYKGWTLYCNGHNLTEKYIKPLVPHAVEYYKRFIKGGDKNEEIRRNQKHSRKRSIARSKC